MKKKACAPTDVSPFLSPWGRTREIALFNSRLQADSMTPTNEQIAMISGAFALLLEDFSLTNTTTDGVWNPEEVVRTSEEALARALAASLRCGAEGDELAKLLQCASEILELALTAM